MTDRDRRLHQAQLRMELRTLEVEIERIRHEQQFFRRLGFERELQDVQLLDLQARHREAGLKLRQLQHRTQRRGSAQVGWLSWVVMSPLLLLMAVQSLFGRRTRSAPRRAAVLAP